MKLILITKELFSWIFTDLIFHFEYPISARTKVQQEAGDDLSFCELHVFPQVCSLPSLLAINLMKMEIQIFQTVAWPHVDHLNKGSCLGASTTKPEPCLLWCRCIFSKWRYIWKSNALTLLSPNVKWYKRWKLMRKFKMQISAQTDNQK